MSKKSPSVKPVKKWQEVESVSDQEFVGFDPLLNFTSPEMLEQWMGAGDGKDLPVEHFQRSGYEHLKEVKVDLDRAGLTDKQLVAVSLVFYGGLRKNRAARAMNITSQALSDHIKAALKKIQASLSS